MKQFISICAFVSLASCASQNPAPAAPATCKCDESPPACPQRPDASDSSSSALESSVVTVTSNKSFEKTILALKTQIANNGLSLMAEIDHANNAMKNQLDLPPTTVLIFGKPQVGTKLMKAQRTIAIDLPQKYLIWQDGDKVSIAFNDPAHLQKRHGFTTLAPVFDKVVGLLSKMANEAAQ